MRILLTGGTGYLGRKLAQQLSASGHSLALIIRSGSDTTALKDCENKVNFLNIESPDFVEGLQDHGPFEVCIHCATCYGRSTETVEQVQRVNFDFPVKLLELLAAQNTRCFINIDTPLPEQVSSYAFYKARFREHLRDQGQVPCRINLPLQYFYGEQEPAGRLISSLAEAALSGASSFDLSPGEQRRDFIHVDDVVSAIERVVDQLQELEDGWHNYELGTGRAVSIKELVALIKKSCPDPQTDFRFGALPYRQAEPMELMADIAKTSSLLDWRPRVSLEKGIEKVIQARMQEAKCDI